MNNSNINDNENNSEITPEVNETEAPSDSSESLNNNEEAPQLGNGYNPMASSNREAFTRGLNDNYADRIARNKANLAQARARSNETQKKGEDGKLEDKNSLDRAKDKANVLKNKTALMGSQIDNARSKAFQMMHPIEAQKIIAKKAIKKWLIGILLSSLPMFLCIFVVFIACFIVLDLFTTEGSATGNGNIVGNYTYVIDGQSISNIKVRLLKCEGYEAIPGEELIDFETYITGVVYQENGNGPYEALKAQAVAARSYALTRAKVMGGAYGLSLEEEDGQWILSIRSCTSDQVFCNPNEGCWSKVPGGQTSADTNVEDCTVYSGTTNNENYWSRGILAEDSNVRKAVNDTQGEVLVDSNGDIVYTTYLASNQTKWNSLANQGYDYFEILVEEYGSGVSLASPTYNTPITEGSGEATGTMINPCPTAAVTSEFGPRKAPTAGASSNHKGIDLGAPEGTDIIASDGGEVIVAKWNDTRGYYIDIDHGNGIVTRYQHLSKMLVSVGDKVDKGQSIAKVGSTGIVTGAHLHFEVIVNGTHENPRNYIDFPKKS